MSRLSLGTKLASAFALTLILMLVAAAVAVTKMGALADRTADAKQGAVLDEQIMSMEIAAREALDVEATAILYGAPAALDGRLEAAWKSNDGDAFAESLAEARRLAVLDMPSRLKEAEAAGKALEASIAADRRARPQGRRGGRARQPPALDPARLRRLRREEPVVEIPVRGVQRGGVDGRGLDRLRRQAHGHHRRRASRCCSPPPAPASSPAASRAAWP